MIFKRKIYDKNYPHKITAQQFSERLMRSFIFPAIIARQEKSLSVCLKMLQDYIAKNSSLICRVILFAFFVCNFRFSKHLQDDVVFISQK